MSSTDSNEELFSEDRRRFLRKVALAGTVGAGAVLAQSVLKIPPEVHASTDQLVKIDSADTTADFLNSKITTGVGLSKSILSPGGNEQLNIGATSSSLVSTASRTVWRDATTTYVKDGLSGVVANYNGSTRDSNAIQAAINALANGGTVFLREGTYSLSTGLSIGNSNLTFKMSKGAVLQPNSGVTADVLTINASDVILDSVSVDGSLGGGTHVRIGSSSNSQRCSVYNSNCLEPRVHGIRLDYLSGVCFVYGNRVQAINVGPSGSGILIQGSDHHVFENDVGGFGSGAGIGCSNAGNVSIVGNQIYVNFIGIDVYLPSRMRIIGNNIEANRQQGIRVSADIAPPPAWRTVTIQGNTISNNGQQAVNPNYSAGIHLSGSQAISDVVVSGNICNDTQSTKTQNYGIRIENSSLDYFIVAENLVHDNLILGVSLVASGTHNIIFNNLG